MGKVKGWLYYDFPPRILAKNRKRFNNKGQRQKWYAFRYFGDGSDINLTAYGPQEFTEWRWAELKTIADTIVPFKRAVYEQLIVEFADFAIPAN